MNKLMFLSVAMFTCAASALLAPRTVESPDAALRATVDQLLLKLQQNATRYRKDPASFYAMVDEVVVPRFDVAGIARFALGRHGRSATPEQRQQFADVLALTLVHTYADFMLEHYDSIELTWKPARAAASRSDQVKINTVLTGNGGAQHPVGFTLHQVDGDWKIHDLEIQGVSLALNHRAQIDAEIRRTSLDVVIARMTKKDLLHSRAAAR